MVKVKAESLLSDRKVVEEINRHLWLESEKAGYDIGFEKASQDWIKKFSSEWIRFNMSQNILGSSVRTRQRTRRAKSYLHG